MEGPGLRAIRYLSVSAIKKQGQMKSGVEIKTGLTPNGPLPPVRSSLPKDPESSKNSATHCRLKYVNANSPHAATGLSLESSLLGSTTYHNRFLLCHGTANSLVSYLHMQNGELPGWQHHGCGKDNVQICGSIHSFLHSFT